MTIAICIKVDDGIVIASDSASTIFGDGGVINVYRYANKIFNLYKGLPVGAVSWGVGNIGHSSISTLIKDLRNRLMYSNDPDWSIDKDNYTIEDFIDLAEFLVDTSTNFSRFRPGAPSIGGPKEVATITKHEGFKWVKRKHYYSKELNP